MGEFLVEAAKIADDYASLVTAIIAFGALATAIWSLYAQKRTARRRAAIDFFLKTEMDKELLEAWDRFNKAVDLLKQEPDINTFAKREEYKHIRAYLNVHELLATGVNNKVFDRRVAYDFWSDTFLNAVTDAQRVITHARSAPHSDYTYLELINLDRRWREAAWRWGRG